jgi:HAD superfamily hydrolase (TIGR01450 family)
MDTVLAGRPPLGNVVCDLDGVVYLLGTPVPGAGEALTRLEQAGYTVTFVTNNSTRSGEAVAAKVESLTGYPARADQVVGSAGAAVALLGPDSGPVLVVGGDGIRAALAIAGVPETEDPRSAASVIVGLDPNLSYDRLRDAAMAIRLGARFIATNTDATFPTPDGPWPGAGSIVAAIRVASGTEPEVAGKPHIAIRSLIRSRLAPGPVWVVGDRPETDLAMAKAEGWTAVLVLTGIIEHPEQVPDEYRPDMVLESITDLAEALHS